MAETGISTLILTIAAITIAVLITGVMFTIAVNFSASINRTSNNLSESLLREFTIVYTSNVQTNDSNISIFVVNSGEISISLSSFIVLFDDQFVNYNNTESNFLWNVTWPGQSSPKTKLNPTELMQIHLELLNEESFEPGSHSITVSADGYTDTVWISI